MDNQTETREGFDGFVGGAVYDILARLTGYGSAYYRRAARALPIRPGMQLVDLGCGTASLTIAMARRLETSGQVIGIDIAKKQLDRGREKISREELPVELLYGSVAELPFEDGSMDGVAMSQVLHALPKDIRNRMISEALRTLKPGGFFGLVEWCRPRFGYSGVLWLPSLLKHRDSENWRGTYPRHFTESGFEMISDRYLDSLNRCQIFRKH